MRYRKGNDTQSTVMKGPNRKQKRKETRRMKKIKRNAYHMHKSLSEVMPAVAQKKKRKRSRKKKADVKQQPSAAEELDSHSDDDGVEDVESGNSNKERHSTKNCVPMVDRSAHAELERYNLEVAKEARKHNYALVNEENREIKRYEKLLGFNRRRSKNMPTSMKEAGLDYVLDVCDSESRKKYLQDSEPESEGDSGRDDSGDEHEEEVSDLSETDAAMEAEAESSEEEKAESSEEEKAEEDNMEAEEAGEPSAKKKRVSFAPEVESAKEKSNTAEASTKLRAQLNGMINRLSEGTANASVGRIEELCYSYSRNDVTTCLTEVLFKSCLRDDIQLPNRMILEHAYFVALLYNRLSLETTAKIVESLCKKLNTLIGKPDADGSKTAENCFLLLSDLVRLRVIGVGVLFDWLAKLLEDFNAKSVGYILLILERAGFALRKEDATRFRDCLLRIQQTAEQSGAEMESQQDTSRVRFMLETLTAVKNNNITKVLNYDPELAEHLLKQLKAVVSPKPIETPLKVSLDELLNAESRGRWWIVGSSVTVQKSGRRSEGDLFAADQFSQELLELARQQRMNSELRRTVFCIIMSSEDALDAFTRLRRLSLKGQNQREIAYICIDCCMQEVKYNSYYAELLTLFCRRVTRYQLTVQYATWDNISKIEELGPSQRRNLGLCISDLIIQSSLQLPALKVFDVTNLTSKSIKLLRSILVRIISSLPNDELTKVFNQCSRSKANRPFCSALRIFIQHYVRNENVTKVELIRKIELIEEQLVC